MEVRRLNGLARQLREVALKASQDGGELPLSTGELAIVEHEARHPGSTISEITRGTGLAQSRVSRVVQDLSSDRVLQVWQDPRDRRQTRVRLDPEAHRQTFEEYGSRPIEAALAKAVPQLTDAEVAQASELLTALADLLGHERR